MLYRCCRAASLLNFRDTVESGAEAGTSIEGSLSTPFAHALGLSVGLLVALQHTLLALARPATTAAVGSIPAFVNGDLFHASGSLRGLS